MSKRPPLGTTGKLALAGKRSRARQLLDREQCERNRRDLLSLVGKNSSLAVSSGSGQGPDLDAQSVPTGLAENFPHGLYFRCTGFSMLGIVIPSGDVE